MVCAFLGRASACGPVSSASVLRAQQHSIGESRRGFRVRPSPANDRRRLCGPPTAPQPRAHGCVSWVTDHIPPLAPWNCLATPPHKGVITAVRGDRQVRSRRCGPSRADLHGAGDRAVRGARSLVWACAGRSIWPRGHRHTRSPRRRGGPRSLITTTVTGPARCGLRV
jgi:hypothetical protein